MIVYKLYSENTIEEKVIDLQNRKKELFRNLFSKKSSNISISKEDLQFLLEK